MTKNINAGMRWAQAGMVGSALLFGGAPAVQAADIGSIIGGVVGGMI
jgi:hypothetical protein